MSVKSNGDEAYRITHLLNGHWIWCDSYGNKGGDNIDLVREIEPGTCYADAVYRLSGAPTVPTVRPQPPRLSEPKRRPPVLPLQGVPARDSSRKYLRGRGISPASILRAEKAGMLRYVDGAVLFVGYDRAHVAQNATRRAIAPADPIQKRDLRGSDKSYPPMLRGDPANVWIVEGGLDALALHDVAIRNGHESPTVIVSGGANVCSFLECQDVQTILKRAKRVTVAGENEKNPEAQAKADAGHRKQAQRVAEITEAEVVHWTPKPEQGKDLAEMNAKLVLIEIEKRQAAEKAQIEAENERRQTESEAQNEKRRAEHTFEHEGVEITINNYENGIWGLTSAQNIESGVLTLAFEDHDPAIDAAIDEAYRIGGVTLLINSNNNAVIKINVADYFGHSEPEKEESGPSLRNY